MWASDVVVVLGGGDIVHQCFVCEEWDDGRHWHFGIKLGQGHQKTWAWIRETLKRELKFQEFPHLTKHDSFKTIVAYHHHHPQEQIRPDRSTMGEEHYYATPGEPTAASREDNSNSQPMIMMRMKPTTEAK